MNLLDRFMSSIFDLLDELVIDEIENCNIIKVIVLATIPIKSTPV